MTARYTGLWQVEALAESANAAREELRVKGEQLALMRQSTQVHEQENLAKEQQAEVLRERQALLERDACSRYPSQEYGGVRVSGSKAPRECSVPV